MPARFGLGPVFAADCLTSSRRWQVYAGRSMLVGSVLVVIALVWINRYSGRQFLSFQEHAAAGSTLIRAIMGLELTLALAIVPAVTAGAICQDKMRGGLTLMMVSDLSDAEIVLGRLGSRLVTVLGVIACGFPVLAILTSLGGVDPLELLTATMIIVGVSVLAVCVSMTFSVWASKPHEALMATYAALGVWLLTLLTWVATFRRFGIAPGFLHFSNPFWLIGASEWHPLAASPFVRLRFSCGKSGHLGRTDDDFNQADPRRHSLPRDTPGAPLILKAAQRAAAGFTDSACPEFRWRIHPCSGGNSTVPGRWVGDEPSGSSTAPCPCSSPFSRSCSIRISHLA